MVKLVTGHTTVTVGVVYRCPNVTKESNEKIQNAIREVTKGDCIVMGDFNHGNVQWESTGVEDQQFGCLIQDNFLTQQCIEPTRGARDLFLSSQKEFVDNVKIQEPLGSSEHNQLHFNFNIKIKFSKARSCLTNCMFFEEITKWMDEGSPVDIIYPGYMDFQKALNINWIEQWLTDRRQRVDGEVSNWKPVLSGVPQGSAFKGNQILGMIRRNVLI